MKNRLQKLIMVIISGIAWTDPSLATLTNRLLIDETVVYNGKIVKPLPLLQSEFHARNPQFLPYAECILERNKRTGDREGRLSFFVGSREWSNRTFADFNLMCYSHTYRTAFILPVQLGALTEWGLVAELPCLYPKGNQKMYVSDLHGKSPLHLFGTYGGPSIRAGALAVCGPGGFQLTNEYSVTLSHFNLIKPGTGVSYTYATQKIVPVRLFDEAHVQDFRNSKKFSLLEPTSFRRASRGWGFNLKHLAPLRFAHDEKVYNQNCHWPSINPPAYSPAETLPRYFYSPLAGEEILEMSEFECPICQEDFVETSDDSVLKPSQTIVRAHCARTSQRGHRFCENCIQSWIERESAKARPESAKARPKCPLCRGDLESIEASEE